MRQYCCLEGISGGQGAKRRPAMEAEEVRFDWATPEIAEIFGKAVAFNRGDKRFWYAANIALAAKGSKVEFAPWADTPEIRRALEAVKNAARSRAARAAPNVAPVRLRRVRRKEAAVAVAPSSEAELFADAVQSAAGRRWSPPFEEEALAAPRFVRYLRAMLLPRRRLIRGPDNLANIRLFTRPAQLTAPPPPPPKPEESVAASLKAMARRSSFKVDAPLRRKRLADMKTARTLG